MEEKKTLLILRLEGALQSWGDHSKWDIRDSGDFPSKSGVVGLLACAMGMERGNPEIAALSSALHMAVRADRPGVRMLDYQTVQGHPLYNAEGKPRASSTVVSPRWYLQDASFLVALELPDFWRKRVEAALKRPVSGSEELCSIPPGMGRIHGGIRQFDGCHSELSGWNAGRG